MSDPRDGRDDGMDTRPFTLPCRHEQIIEALIRALAIDRGVPEPVIRTSFGIP